MINESKNQLFAVFKNFDKDSSGYVDQAELFEMAKQLNVELSQAEVDKVRPFPSPPSSWPSSTSTTTRRSPSRSSGTGGSSAKTTSSKSLFF